MAAVLGIRSDRAALKETSWAAALCSHATSAPVVTDFFHPVFTLLFTDQSLTFCLWFFFSVLDDTDDWDFEVFSKPSEVQNDLYAGNEDEEGEGEDVDGKKVMVRI